MYYINTGVLAILAFTCSAVAVPFGGSRIAPWSNETYKKPHDTQLSLTKQLRLADNAAEFFELLPNNEDFVFDLNQEQVGAGKGGELIAANRGNFPALVGTGAGMAVGRVEPCGMNTLHVHPRSAELQVVIQGRLITEMVPENGVLDADGNRRVIRTELGPFEMTPFYQGSIHTQFNPDCEDAVFVASFASEDFGTLQALDGSFAMDDEVIAAAFGQTIAGEDIETVRDNIPASIARGVEECLMTCDKIKRSAKPAAARR